MRAIKINAHERKIVEIDVPAPDHDANRPYKAHNDALREAVGCELLTTGTILRGGETVLVDDEGLLKLSSLDDPFFLINGAHQPFAGNGVVVGAADENGDTTDLTITVEEVAKLVTWASLREVRESL